MNEHLYKVMKCNKKAFTQSNGNSKILVSVSHKQFYCRFAELSGKYIKDGEEVHSSEETLNEETQAKLWELSARLVRLEGYEPLELTPPAPEEPTVKEKVKKEKKSKKEKVAATDKPDENAVVENGHTAENGETEKGDDEQKRDAEDVKDEQILKSDKIEEVAEKIEQVAENSESKQETACTNGDCKTTADEQTAAVESNQQEVQKVEINGGGDCVTASE